MARAAHIHNPNREAARLDLQRLKGIRVLHHLRTLRPGSGVVSLEAACTACRLCRRRPQKSSGSGRGAEIAPSRASSSRSPRLRSPTTPLFSGWGSAEGRGKLIKTSVGTLGGVGASSYPSPQIVDALRCAPRSSTSETTLPGSGEETGGNAWDGSNAQLVALCKRWLACPGEICCR